jgi:hypothetical protein
MQLSQSSVSPDANPFALLFAGSTPTGSCALPTADGADTGADFENLFPDLTPTSATETTTAAELAGAAMVLALAPTLVTPATEPDVLEGGSSLIEGASGESTEDLTSGAEPSTPSPTTEGGRGVRHARAFGHVESGEVKGGAAGHGHPASAEPMVDGPTPVSRRLPNENAAEKAFHTPRFEGLPDVALTHRQAASLPPGLTRLMGSYAEPTTPETTDAGSAAPSMPGADGTAVTEETLSAIARGASERPASLTGWAKRMAPPTETVETAGTDVSGNDDTSLPSAAVATAVAGVVPAVGLTRAQGEAVARFNPHRSVEVTGTEAGAKFADRVGARANRKGEHENAPMKSFVSDVKEEVAGTSTAFGTSVAKAVATMFGTTLQSSPAHATPDFAVAGLRSAEGLNDVAATVAPAAETPDSVRSAHEAVEVVLHAVEHVASQEQTSVNLKFTVGDSQLSVRVELHANEVRATFRTESEELRSALAQEWQSAASGPLGSDRPTRVVPAFVAAADQSAFNATAGDSSSRQQHSGAQRSEAEAAVAVSRRRDPAARAATSAPVSSGVYPASSHTSHRLHTLA